MKILVINANSSQSMTEGIRHAIDGMALSKDLDIVTYTAPPESPASINNGADIAASTEAVFNHLRGAGLLQTCDAALVACYSVHPLVPLLQAELARGGKRAAVTGIFEASILASLSLLPLRHPSPAWGIVTTGTFWEKHLSEGVMTFLGQQGPQVNCKFAGVQSTGLDAADFHGGLPPDVVRGKLSAAATRLFRSGEVMCVVMGCAGMAGLEDIIRAAAVEEYGMALGSEVAIIDGVKAGIGIVEQMVRNGRMFTRT